MNDQKAVSAEGGESAPGNGNDEPLPVDPPPPIDGWPSYPRGYSADTYTEFAKAAYGAEVAIKKAARERDVTDANRQIDLVREGRKSDEDIEGRLLANYHESIREVAKTSASQVAASADVVQKAAAAIATLYTGLLGFVYAVGEVALPARSLIPVAFLGVAIFLSTGYVSYIRKPSDVELEIPAGTARSRALDQTINFIIWSRQRYLRRASWIRAAVVSLGVGLLFLPVPFLSTGTGPSSQSDATVPSAPSWPAVPDDSIAEGRPAMEVALFTAQVGEVATLRAREPATAVPYLSPDVEQAIWIAAILGAVGVAAIAGRGETE